MSSMGLERTAEKITMSDSLPADGQIVNTSQSSNIKKSRLLGIGSHRYF